MKQFFSTLTEYYYSSYTYFFPPTAEQQKELYQQLKQASEQGDIFAVRTLLAKGAPVNDDDSHSASASLVAAATHGYTEIASLLIDRGAFINDRTSGHTLSLPLHEAVQGGHEAMVSLLIRSGANLNKHNQVGGSPIRYAASGESLAIALLLIESGADINDANKHDSTTALHDAIMNYDMVKLLIDHGAKTNVVSWLGSLLHHAVFKEAPLEVAELLIQHGASVEQTNENGATALHKAVDRRVTNYVTLFVQRGAAVNALDKQQETPLHKAAHLGLDDIVRYLVEQGADTTIRNYNNETALDIASRAYEGWSYADQFDSITRGIRIDVEGVNAGRARIRAILRERLQKQAQLQQSTDRITPAPTSILSLNAPTAEITPDEKEKLNKQLFNAISSFNVTRVLDLLQKGASANAISASTPKETPLHYVAFLNNKELRKSLQKKSECIDFEEENLQSSLEIINLLLKHGAIIDLENSYKQTPLHTAILYNQFEIAALLLTRGANSNAQDDEKDTPLHYAVKQNHLEMVELLLNHCANVNAANMYDETPLHLAATLGLAEIASLLVERKADIFMMSIFDETALSIVSTKKKGENAEKAKCFSDGRAKIKAFLNEALKKQSQNQNHGFSFKPDMDKPLSSNTNNSFSQKLHQKEAVSKRKKITAKKIKKPSSPPQSAPLPKLATGIPFSQEDCNKRFLQAIIQGKDPETVALLLDQGAEIETCNSLQQTALSLAVIKGHTALVALLLSRGANIHAKSTAENTPLHLAAVNGFFEIAESLITHRADIHAENSHGQTPLHLAAFAGRTEIIGLLLEKGANANSQDKEGNTPLHLAVYQEQKDAVILLLDDGASIHIYNATGQTACDISVLENNDIMSILWDKNGEEMSNPETSEAFFSPQALLQRQLLRAISRGESFETISVLIEQNLPLKTVDPFQLTALHYAAMEGRLDIVKLLISKGANIHATDTYNCTALFYCSRKGYEDIVRLLITLNISLHTPNKALRTALHAAASEGHTATVALLLDKGAEVDAKDKEGRTPLYLACCEGFEEVVNLLLKRSADPKAQCLNQNTPLHGAAFFNQWKIAELLIGIETVDINARNAHQETPLHLAAFEDHTATVALLLDKGAEVDAKDKEGRTPLYLACCIGIEEVVNLLLKRSADPNAQCLNQNTPLHGAAFFNQWKIAELLIGIETVDINARNARQETPLHFSVSQRNREVTETLLEADADIDAEDAQGQDPIYKAEQAQNTDLFFLLYNEVYARFVKRTESFRNLLNKAFLNNIEGAALMRELAEELSRPLFTHKKHNVPDTQSDTPLNPLQQLLNDRLFEIVSEEKDLKTQQKYLEEIESLVKQGANLKAKNSNNDTLLDVVSKTKNTVFAGYLLGKKEDMRLEIMDMIMKPFLLAAEIAGISSSAKNERTKPIDEMVPNLLGEEENKEWTPLHLASQEGRIADIETLLQKGANVNAADGFQQTPLHYAAFHGHIAVVQLLLKHHASSNARNSDNETPLHLASANGYASIVRELLAHQTNVDAKDKFKQTPLQLATFYGHTAVAESLLSHGADIHAKDEDGRTALDLASASAKNDIDNEFIKPEDVERINVARAKIRALLENELKKQQNSLWQALSRLPLKETSEPVPLSNAINEQRLSTLDTASRAVDNCNNASNSLYLPKREWPELNLTSHRTFIQALATVRAHFSSSHAPSCYVVYPRDNTTTVKAVKKLVKHLREAGIIVHYELDRRRSLTSIDEFIEKIQFVDFVIIAAAPTLLREYHWQRSFENPTELPPYSQAELRSVRSLMTNNQHRFKLIPVLLEKTATETLPPFARPYVTQERHMEQVEYFKLVFGLVETILGIAPGNSQFKEIKTTFKQYANSGQFPLLPASIPPLHQPSTQEIPMPRLQDLINGLHKGTLSPNLTTLQIPDHFTDKDAEDFSAVLPKLTKLTRLTLSQTNLKEPSMRLIAPGLKARAASLTHLDLSHNYLGNAGVSALCEVLPDLTKLSSLSLKGNSIDKKGMETLYNAVREHPSLTQLDLSDNALGEMGLKYVLRLLESVSSITLTGGEDNIDERLAIDKRIKANKAHSKALFDAIQKGDINEVKRLRTETHIGLLLKNKEGKTPEQYATECNHPDIADYLKDELAYLETSPEPRIAYGPTSNTRWVSEINPFLGIDEKHWPKSHYLTHEALKVAFTAINQTFNTKPKQHTAFINYAWDDKAFEKEVERLESYLTLAGVGTKFDRKNTVPTDQFIQELYDVDVVVVCGNATAIKKYNWTPSDVTDKEPVIKSEFNIIQQMLTKNDEVRRRFRPLVFEGSTSESLIPLLSSYVYFHFQYTDYFEILFELVRGIYDIEYKDPAFEQIRKTFHEARNAAENPAPVLSNNNNNNNNAPQVQAQPQQQQPQNVPPAPIPIAPSAVPAAPLVQQLQQSVAHLSLVNSQIPIPPGSPANTYHQAQAQVPTNQQAQQGK